MEIISIHRKFISAMKPKSHRNDIDLLRGVAIGGVLFHHSGLLGFNWGGFAGVDVFFVISGFLISKNILDSQNFTFADFYMRRIKRLFPAYIFAILSTLTLSFLVIPPEQLFSAIKTAFASTLFIANIQLFRSMGYFSTGAAWNPFTHLWSLAVEEQFYIFWPVAILILRKHPKCFLVAILIFIFVSISISEYLIYSSPEGAFYLPWSRAFEFLIGSVLATPSVRAAASRLSSTTANALCTFGFLAIALAYAIIDQLTGFPGIAALLPCLGAASVIFSGERGTNFVSLIRSESPGLLVGKISYSLYLIHWPTIVLAKYLVNRELVYVESVFCILASTALAYASWRFIEEPFRSGHTLTDPRKALSFGVCAMAGVATVIAIIWLEKPAPWGKFQQPIGVSELANAKQDFHDAPCFASEDQSILSKDTRCFAPAGGTAPIAALWGDSHAAHLASAFRNWSLVHGFDVAQYTRPGCGPFANVLILPANEGHRACQSFNVLAFRAIVSDPRVRVVVIGAQWWSHLNGFDRVTRSGLPLTVSEAQDNFVSVLRSQLEELTADGRKVIIIGQVPTLDFDIVDCLQRAAYIKVSESNCLSFDAVPKWTIERNVNQFLALASRGIENVSLVSAIDTFCGTSRCETRRDGEYLYIDSNHISRKAADNIFKNPVFLFGSDRVN